MEDIISLLCGCIKGATDIKEKNPENMDILSDILTRAGSKFNRSNPLNGALINNLWSLRGRRQHVRNVPIHITPTTFDEDHDEDEEEDSEGGVESVLNHGKFANQDYETLEFKCKERGVQFVDPMFPPSTASLFADPSEWDDDHNIEWVRASEMCEDPQMFVEGPSRFDIKQGALGDCWLLAAMANLTLHEDLFSKVVPHDQSFEQPCPGIFHFRLWQYGEWIDVVVDDYLPTRNGKLLYIKSAAENEFWSALLEKAYAKIHGSYEALRGGSTAEAMVDFSGGSGETYDLDDESQWMAIYNVMMKCSKRGSMMSCFINSDPNVEAKTRRGLIKGHAYSVTKVVKAKVDTGNKAGNFPLVRLRNPWGDSTEWNGTWSDGSAVWQFVSEDEKGEIGLNFEHDGEFYMSQKDFMQNFSGLELCNLSPDTLEDNPSEMRWFEKQFHGSWIAGETAGGCRNFLDTFACNPQYVVTLEDHDDDEDDLCTCLISLMQKGTRKRKVSSSTNRCLTIGFSLYRLIDPSETYPPLPTDFFKYTLSCGKSGSFVNSREVSQRFKLQPGTYVIIPSTFDPEEEGDFLLRIFSEKFASAESVYLT